MRKQGTPVLFLSASPSHCDPFSRLLHEPAVADDERLAGERVQFESGKEKHHKNGLLPIMASEQLVSSP
jgi:hypothetical protein